MILKVLLLKTACIYCVHAHTFTDDYYFLVTSTSPSAFQTERTLSVFFSAEIHAISHGSYDLASWALQQAEVPMERGSHRKGFFQKVQVITGPVAMPRLEKIQ